jgi:phosphohistidine phosphatase
LSAASTVRRLTLLRHAHAEAKRPNGTDAERTLDRRGLAEAAEMARRLGERRWPPDLILVSPAIRTRQTATAIERQFGLLGEQTLVAADLYLAEAEELLDAIRTIPPATCHLLVVAHNPGITDLARLLESREARDLDTAGMFTGILAVEDWTAVGPEALRETLHDSPQYVFEPPDD